ncbi:hypothetical protein B0H13DRAFT_2411515 [Mycena leptocephala]|nr:hypothetical protein B0H13DRAFT_2411515 [Mycena leptocephala]
MSSHEQITNELWNEMFGYLPKSTLATLSQTSRRFCDISRPHLFSALEFHPYASNEKGVVLPPASVVQRAIDRLDFWTSDGIAPLVRSCEITPWERNDRRGPKFSTSDHPYTLLNAFFDSLVHFSGLQIIRAKDVRFTQVGVTNLCRLPNLRSLRITNYSVAPNQIIDVSSLRLQHLSRFELSGTRDSEPADPWVHLLHPDRLQDLEITLSPALVSAFDNLPPFSHTRKLSVELDVLNVSQNMRLLSKFPALQILSMSQSGYRNTVGVELSTSVLPPAVLQLKEYTGIYQTLYMVLPLSTLTHLTVQMCHPHHLIAELEEVRAPVNVTSLCVDFVSIPDMQSFHAFCGALPALTRLRIDVVDVLPLEFDFDGIDFPEGDPDWKIPEFLETLVKSALPPRIQRLAVFWRIEDGYLSTLPNFKKSSARLMKKYLSLNAVWLGLYGYTARTRKMPDGTVTTDEVVADENQATVKGMCERFDSSWAEMEMYV